MLTEPDIDKNLIQETIEENFGFEISSLTFVKGGEASWGYKVETSKSEVYFCKIHTGLTDHEKRFELTYRLFNKCGIKNITHPLKNLQGDLVFYLDNYPTALFNFIPGSNSNDKPLDEKQQFALGELLGQIHQAKGIIGEFAIKEDFEYGKIARLRETLEKAESFLGSESEYKKKTALLLVENKGKILKGIQDLEDLGDRLRNQQLDFVICHGEPHPWNTMVNEKGEVFLIDWDDCLFAPKEKDLNFIKDNASKLKGYESAVGKLDLNPEIIRYYNKEWNISEIDAWSASLLYENANDTQNQHYLKHFLIDLHEIDYT